MKTNPSHSSHQSEDLTRRDFLRALDKAPFEVTDWEAKFIETCMDRSSYSPLQRDKIDAMRRDYEHRL